MNLRTLGRLLILGNLIFIGALANVFDSKLSLPASLGPLLILAGIVGGIAGGVSLLLVYKGKILPKCPKCDTIVEFHEGQSLGNLRQTIYADCPRCGCLEFSFRQFSGIKIERVTPHGRETQDDEEPDEGEVELESAETKRPFVQRHAMGLILFLAPVATSIIWASLHHRFTFFYLGIPGVWCIGVAYSLLDQWESGIINWKGGGITFRRKNPIVFWGWSLVWLLFYAFAAYFPIGYAKQERSKEEKQVAPTPSSTSTPTESPSSPPTSPPPSRSPTKAFEAAGG